ncbi:MAG: MarR family transcriptional regulator [Rhizobium sp.]|nr:MarR family transcriptional regulator [Rhizobium sp.]
MSRNILEKYERRTIRAPAERLLLLLKTRGPQTASSLGSALKISSEAARQQLVQLAAEGLTDSYFVSRGVGRPSQFWQLTPKASSQFPDTHAELTVKLLQAIRTQLGQEALDALITTRENETMETYGNAMRQIPELADRVAILAELRTEEGYMAEVQEGENGDLMLVENHCPICAAATECQGFCRAELQIFRSLLGPQATVERTDHIVQGSRRCAYRITKTE